MKIMRFIFKRRLNAWDALMMGFTAILASDGWYFSAFFVNIAGSTVSVIAENLVGFKYMDGEE